MTTSDEIFRATLWQLEANFTVSLVAALELQSFDHRTPTQHALDDMRRMDFSQAPVMLNGEIVGVIDVLTEYKGSHVADWMQPLTGRLIVSSQASLRSVIRELARDSTRYRLVAGTGGVTGILTRTDLQKLPVQLLAYSFVAHLESVIASAIEGSYPEDVWLDTLSKGVPQELPDEAASAMNGRKLGPEAVRALKRSQESHRKRDTTPYLMEMTFFPQKWYLAWKLFGLGTKFAEEMAGIQRYLRNSIAHGHRLAADDFQLEQLERRLGLCEHWINHFTDFIGENTEAITLDLARTPIVETK